jgi:effector-binding domain-containing protein
MSRQEPKLEYRGVQPYVCMRRSVTMRELGTVLPPLHRELGAWMREHGVKPFGAPFWRYLVVDMKGKLEVDVGFPVSAPVKGEGSVIADVLPPGTWAISVHHGHPVGLMQATADLLSWAEKKGVSWNTDGRGWAGRVEWYLSDPATQPDMSTWTTEIAFLTAIPDAAKEG